MGFTCRKCGKAFIQIGAEFAHTCRKGEGPHFQYRIDADGNSKPAFQDATGKFKITKGGPKPKEPEPEEKPKTKPKKKQTKTKPKSNPKPGPESEESQEVEPETEYSDEDKEEQTPE